MQQGDPLTSSGLHKNATDAFTALALAEIYIARVDALWNATTKPIQ